MTRPLSRRGIAALLAAAATTATPLSAQDAPLTPAQQQTETIKQAAALEEAKTALEKARIDRDKQVIEALGLKSDTTGKTELKGTAGAFEGWLLSANAIDEAADAIAGKIEGTAKLKTASIVLLAADETFNLALPRVMLTRLTALQQSAVSARDLAGCSSSDDDDTGAAPVGTAAFPPVAAIGALLGAIRTDTEISAFDGPTDARLVVNALAQRAARAQLIIPSDYSVVADKGDVLKQWNDLTKERSKVVTCRVELAAIGDARKAGVQLLDGWLATLAQFETTQVFAGEGVSPLVQAARLEQLASQGELAILRVYVEKTGGSVLVRRNLFTALGAPAVGITGGAVVGWRAVNPASGAVLTGGNLSCRTKLTNMGAIHAGKVGRADCTRVSVPKAGT